MKDLSIKEILDITNGKLIIGNEETVCENFCTDTSKLQDGDIFVGIKGENKDGGSFFSQAIEKGAKGCIINSELNVDNSIEEYIDENKNMLKNKFIITVENSTEAIQKIAKYKREQYNIPVVAITGSVGKTSTKDIVASVLSEKYNVLKTEGNYNNHIGVPLTILRLKAHDALVVEMGMNHLREISVLTKIAQPTIAVITNVGTAHIGNLGSRENILKAKIEILEGLKDDGVLIINNDNDLLNSWYLENKNKFNIHTVGIENESDEMAKNIKQSEYGVTFDLCTAGGKEENIDVPIGGRSFVYNSLTAVAVGKILNIDLNKIKKGIAKFQLTNKRLDIKESSKGYTIIDDSYNANYDSMKSAIEYLCKSSGNRRIAVLGDMKELGEYSKKLHEDVGKLISKEKIDLLITVGKYAKYIAKSTNVESFIFDNNIDATEKLKKILKRGDTVLLKASNSMKFNEIVSAIL